MVLTIWAMISMFNCIVSLPYWHLKKGNFFIWNLSNGSELIFAIIVFGIIMCPVPFLMFLFEMGSSLIKPLMKD